ncbi:SagB family peptide dehydrogenase [Streptomyces sp. NPDC101150]|uniref:SagB family peptide dehydrogenase n=1 Tax=Streptomyces sp. NPDC101150 TaxID=3366114 RepID=UPI00381BE72D
MEPVGFEPDWSDKPRAQKFYPGIASFPLPVPNTTAPSPTRLRDGLFGPEPMAAAGRDPARFTLPTLSGMLHESYGETARRLAVNANPDFRFLHAYGNAIWSRGTASGGGLYPVSIYWVSGASGPVRPGVHYYSARHHAMQPLLTGDVSALVREAVGDRELAGDTDQFLVLGIKFWQNAFKYNSFSYHAVTMDVGTLVQTWRMWAHARGLPLRPILWFDEKRLGELLNVRGEEEGIFAVVPLHWEGSAAPAPGTVPDGVRARAADRERSRRTLTFPTLRAVHEATARDAARRPPRAALATAAVAPAPERGGRIALPAPEPLNGSVDAALRARRSSFGRFVARPALDPGRLGTVLAGATAAVTFPCDVTDDALPAALAKMYVFVNHVEGIPPGSYEYDPQDHSLLRISGNPPGEFLERNYFLNNYSLDQTAAVIVPTARPAAVHHALGDRGYRLVNAAIGAVAQAAYTTCAATGTGCGAALGFDNVSYIEELGLDGSDEVPLLIVMVGNEHPAPANYRYEIDAHHIDAHRTDAHAIERDL